MRISTNPENADRATTSAKSKTVEPKTPKGAKAASKPDAADEQVNISTGGVRAAKEKGAPAADKKANDELNEGERLMAQVQTGSLTPEAQSRYLKRIDEILKKYSNT